MEQSRNLGAVHSPATADENDSGLRDFFSPRLHDGDCGAPEVASNRMEGTTKTSSYRFQSPKPTVTIFQYEILSLACR